MWNRLLTYFINILLGFLAVYTQNMAAVVVACILAISLVVIDFITGVSASWFVDHRGIESKKLRWSFAKLLVYVMVIMATLAIGIFLHLIDNFITPTPGRSDILTLTLVCVKYEAYVVAWVEIVSNIENCLRIWPDNKLLKYIHFVVSVDFIKKIPNLANALKENGSKMQGNGNK